MNLEYRYFATNDGAQVAVVRADSNPDVSWYEHKAAREVVLADPKDIVIPAADFPNVMKARSEENVWELETGECYHYLDLEDAERDLRNAAAVVQAMRLAEEQEREAKRVEVVARGDSNTNVLLSHITGHLTEIDDVEALGLRLAEGGYKIVKEDA